MLRALGELVGFPVYKKRLVALTKHGVGTVKVDKKRIDLPKIGWVRMREELRYTGEITKVVVSRKNDRWSIPCDVIQTTTNTSLAL